MSNFLPLGMVMLWILVIAQGFIILVMLRHIGVLYEPIGPVGALTTASPLKIGRARLGSCSMIWLAGPSE